MIDAIECSLAKQSDYYPYITKCIKLVKELEEELKKTEPVTGAIISVTINVTNR